jgi:hypothetical protein
VVPSGKDAGSSTSKEVIIIELKDTYMKTILLDVLLQGE